MPLLPRLLSRAGSFFRRVRAIRRTHQTDDPDRLLEFFEPPSPGDIFKPLQKRAELRGLYARVRALRPAAVLEIGTNNGGTLFLFCRAADPTATVISVDLPGGLFGSGYPLLKVPYFRAFGSRRQRVVLLRLDSHAPRTLERVRRALRGRPLDFLFIDGDHTYDGVRQDFETYGPLVRPGGLIAFHDILPTTTGVGGEVPRFWAEVKSRYECDELIEDPNQGMMGVGLVRVPESGVGPVRGAP
jgi:predicted O-methyltransferase YrrM